MEARGNAASYTAQGVNYVRAALTYAPIQSLHTNLFGWWSVKQTTYNKAFHVYAMEWTPAFMRFYVDSRLQAMIYFKLAGKGGKSFWDRGDYPAVTTNGSAAELAVTNIWDQDVPSSPFDQRASRFFASLRWASLLPLR